jgi:hypothetical protein
LKTRPEASASGNGPKLARICGILVICGLVLGLGVWIGAGASPWSMVSLREAAVGQVDVQVQKESAEVARKLDPAFRPPLYPPDAVADERKEAGGDGAVFTSEKSLDEVLAYYRGQLRAAGWRELPSTTPRAKTPAESGGAATQELHCFMGGGKTFYLALAAADGRTTGTTVLLQSSEGAQ